MKRIGLVGVGNISEKAYMPTLRAHKEVQWVLYSRKKERLDELMTKYDLEEGYRSFEELLGSNLDACFIQSPTAIHYEQIKLLLQAGIHVFVDKPVTDDLVKTKELYQLAKQKGLLLFVGFNRRYAPFVTQLKENAEKSYITTAKHRQNHPKESRFSIYDLFIHPLDTAVYLLNSDDIVLKDVRYQTSNNKLDHLVVHIGNEQQEAQVVANFKAGANRELFEVANEAHTIVLEDMDRLITYQGQMKLEQKMTDWDTTLYKRGFVTMIEVFLKALEEEIIPGSQHNTYISHELCEQIALYIEEREK